MSIQRMVELTLCCETTDRVLGFLYRQEYLDTHVFALLHQSTIHQDLIRTNSVALIIGGVCCLSDLNLSPLLVGRDLEDF
jgi:hypothetical protein